MRAALAGGTTSSEALVMDALAACQQHDAANIMISIRAEAALARARAVDSGVCFGPLAGLPIIVKDNIAVAGEAFTGGSPAFAGHIAAADATVVARLAAAGAVVIGKANLHELAFGITSNNAWRGPVRNPYDHDRIAGGSSGGSAASVAAGIVPIALGTDTGGSGRIPHALCGCVGFRPTTGRYPADGVMLLTTTRDTISLSAMTVADIMLTDHGITGDLAPPAVAPSTLRLGVLAPFATEGLSPEVNAAFQAGLHALVAAGVDVVPVSGTELLDIDQAIGLPLVLTEATALWTDYVRETLDQSLGDFAARIASPDVRATFQRMAGPEPVITMAAYRRMMQEQLPRLRAAYHGLFHDHCLTALAFPTVVTTASLIGQDDLLEIQGVKRPLFPTMIRNTGPGSLAGVPGITLPLPVAAGGLPVGLALDAPAGADLGLLSAAAAIEAIFRDAPQATQPR
jgi:indoleacetamide hydrolase